MVIEETPMKAKLEKLQAGTPKSVDKVSKQPCKLKAPADFRFFADLTGPFDLFFESFVPKYRSENSGLDKSKLKQQVLLGVARQSWESEMDAEAKSEFLTQFVEMAETQDKEIVWEEDESEVKENGKKRKKSDGASGEKKEKRAKGTPRPLGSWMVFMAEFRATFDGKFTEAASAGKEIWAKKTAEEKEVYKQKGIKDFEDKQAGKVASDEEKEEAEAEVESEEEEDEEEDADAEDGASRKRKVEETEEEVQAREEAAAEKKVKREERQAKAAAKKAEKEAKAATLEAEKAAKQVEKDEKAAVKKAEKEAAAEAKAVKREADKLKKQQEKEEHEKTNPKKAQTAFFFFLKEFRPQYLAEHPDVKGCTEVAKEAGAKWKAMTDEEKAPFTAANVEATKKYHERCAELGIEVKEKAVKAAKTKGPKKERVPSAFELYSREKDSICKRRNPSLLSKNEEDEEVWNEEGLEKAMLLMWKNASKSEKCVYADQVKALKLKAAVAAEAEAAAEPAEPAAEPTEEPAAEPTEEDAAEEI
jgi:hypothetical protein